MKFNQINVLVVDDDELVFEHIESIIGSKCNISHSITGDNALQIIKKNAIDIVFIDLNLGKLSGHSIIKAVKEYDDSIEIIVISSSSNIDDAISSFKEGIRDFIRKPIQKESLSFVFQNAVSNRSLIKENRALNDMLRSNDNAGLLIGESNDFQLLQKEITKMVETNVDILIVGESGTGKELLAKTLHLQEQDKNRPYITVNCGTIPENLIESVLFGHEKGAFTGAVKKQLGKFELANGGDILLDEIGTLPLHLQAKLLRVLQEREIEPIGLGHAKKLQFRVIAATNENLIELMDQKKFRTDLYYRLKKIVFRMPPLRERKADIPVLVTHFVDKHSRNSIIKTFSSSAINVLMEYDWPGNVRELENTVENLIITSDNNTVTADDIQQLKLGQEVLFINNKIIQNLELPVVDHNSEDGSNISVKVRPNFSLAEASRELERIFILRVLEQSISKREAALKLGIDRRTLYRKLNELGVD